jgi:hypothetical protein
MIGAVSDAEMDARIDALIERVGAATRALRERDDWSAAEAVLGELQAITSVDLCKQIGGVTQEAPSLGNANSTDANAPPRDLSGVIPLWVFFTG